MNWSGIAFACPVVPATRFIDVTTFMHLKTVVLAFVGTAALLGAAAIGVPSTSTKGSVAAVSTRTGH